MSSRPPFIPKNGAPHPFTFGRLGGRGSYAVALNQKQRVAPFLSIKGGRAITLAGQFVLSPDKAMMVRGIFGRGCEK